MLAGSARPAASLSSLSSAFHNLSLASRRNFSTTLPSQRTRTLPDYIPPYPYGPRYTFKQADSGLYGGATIQFGNKISKGRNEGKTRRIWKPNIRKEKLYSEALEKWLDLKVQHRVLRTIKKEGGLDQYLLSDKPSRIKELGVFGWGLRWKVMTSKAMRKRFEEERKELGLEKPATFKEYLARHTMEQQVQAAAEDAEQPPAEIKVTVAADTPSETAPAPNLNTA
ncbi:mitochondrial 54S ribosomal protein YmL24/YmL14 [Coccidioides immitis RS]|uniref:Large ribosomal subunit protein bL28m n=1 Tax=Coccidioides immitis (strain RS) TaxID=246410 RepID=J3KJA2_COCIM|nr:mitochondrial 54S ribosomal protein YmL24/YmL14 [Coccidioides immitis RS]EAS36122.3 50S ribosomal protein L24 [Coccidioides immitis RS]TPX25717.1 39S ribosomal protein L24, mitochondrial [Coccidioides immitis]